jgi:hypothetical protein
MKTTIRSKVAVEAAVDAIRSSDIRLEASAALVELLQVLEGFTGGYAIEVSTKTANFLNGETEDDEEESDVDSSDS